MTLSENEPSMPIRWTLLAWNNSCMLLSTTESGIPVLKILRSRKPGVLTIKWAIFFTTFFACLRFVSEIRRANSPGLLIGRRLRSYKCTLSPSRSFRIFYVLGILERKFPSLKQILIRMEDLELLTTSLGLLPDAFQVHLVISGPEEMHRTLKKGFDEYLFLTRG